MTSLANALAAAVGSQSEKSNDAPAPFVFQTELSVGGGNLGTSAAAPVLQRPVATRELKDYPWLLVRLGLVSVVGKTMPNGRIQIFSRIPFPATAWIGVAPPAQPVHLPSVDLAR